MEFGNVHGKLAGIDFALPNDPEVTTETLNAAKGGSVLQVYVGATKWAEKRWIGKIYPAKTPETEFLKEYSRNFNTIEFGPTFYNIYSPEEINRWANMAADSPGFRFCPKFPQMITHIRRLTNADESTRKFYSSLNAFGNQLGPLLLQLGENFSPKSFPQLKAYLETLPSSIKVSLEVRNKDWFAIESHRAALFNLLNQLNIAWIISDTAGRRDCVHMQLPTADAVIRFVGNNLDDTDYTRIDAWVERFKVWQGQGLQSIWFFIHQHDEAVVPELCNYLIKQLNANIGTDLKAPNLIKD